jgi:hypothetical protein
MPVGKLMPSDFSNKLVGRIGEHLVTAELGRNNIIATPFSGNVPDIDILAYANGLAIGIQVKAIKTGGSWQFDAERFLDIHFEGDKQVIKGKRTDGKPDAIWVFVEVGKALGEDRFFIITENDLQKIIYKHHSAFLQKHGGIRPKKSSSTHAAIGEDPPE